MKMGSWRGGGRTHLMNGPDSAELRLGGEVGDRSEWESSPQPQCCLSARPPDPGHARPSGFSKLPPSSTGEEVIPFMGIFSQRGSMQAEFLEPGTLCNDHLLPLALGCCRFPRIIKRQRAVLCGEMAGGLGGRNWGMESMSV